MDKNRYDNELHVSFSAISSNESTARMIAAAFITNINPTIEELSDIRTAVSEAVTNSIVHGYQNGLGLVYMDMYLKDMQITVIVRDEGCGIADIAEARKPFFTTLPHMERTGMGFAVMEAFMDTLFVESTLGSGTTVTMTKLLGEKNA
ncbi:MAG: anti-sigma F factor [Clostridia bacterium]|nr:anti-sigma F factor [Clostridia bacterium]